MTKRLFPLLLLLVALTPLGGLGPALAQDNVLVMARSADTTGLDPHTRTAFASYRLLELIYEPLVELDAELNIIPALAESWAFNEDATSLTLNLREGVTFHDGSAMDSADVRASFERILDEGTGAAARSRYTGISAIETPDANTVVFALSEPNVPLPGPLASVNAAIISEEAAASGDFSGANGTGPLTSAACAVPLDEYFCYERDVEMALSLLAEAGLADGFSISVIAANAEPPTALSEAQTIQAQLAEIGVEVVIESMEPGTYIDRWLAADFDGAVALNGGRPDPHTMYSRYWTKDGNLQKVANYIDDTLDDLMAAGKVETDPAARYEIFADFQKHLVEMAPWIWLYTGYEYSAQQP
ncbi:MAG: ABC transporter substrate-binding protein [Anaerolineaceae bacterium]|nr:ABC transporter substrate-binding protein [Anaerolineaceae bacterium]